MFECNVEKQKAIDVNINEQPMNSFSCACGSVFFFDKVELVSNEKHSQYRFKGHLLMVRKSGWKMLHFSLPGKK